jgi:hypothetical protein
VPCQRSRGDQALKLEHVWEPAPFPVELPPDQRAVGTAEPPFAAKPWPQRPPWLWQEVPQQPGEVRYAKNWLERGGDVLLLVALTKAECEERHRENETYVVAERLDGWGCFCWLRDTPATNEIRHLRIATAA